MTTTPAPRRLQTESCIWEGKPYKLIKLPSAAFEEKLIKKDISDTKFAKRVAKMGEEKAREAVRKKMEKMRKEEVKAKLKVKRLSPVHMKRYESRLLVTDHEVEQEMTRLLLLVE